MYWALLYSQMVVDTVLHNSKVTELNLDYTQLVFLPFCESGNSHQHFLYDFNGSQLGLGKVI